MRALRVSISAADAADAAAVAAEGAGFEIDVRLIAGVAEDEAVEVLAVDVGFGGGAIELLVAEAADGRVVVRALEVAGVAPPIDARGFVGLATLLFDAANDERGLVASVDDVDAVLIRLFKPLALALAAELVVGRVAVDGVGRVGGLLRLLFSEVVGDAFAPAAAVDARAELVVVGFLTGGAAVREAGLVFSIALTLDATADVLIVFGEAFSVPEDNPSRSETSASWSETGASEPDSTSSARGVAGAAADVSGSLLSAIMLADVLYNPVDCLL